LSFFVAVLLAVTLRIAISVAFTIRGTEPGALRAILAGQATILRLAEFPFAALFTVLVPFVRFGDPQGPSKDETPLHRSWASFITCTLVVTRGQFFISGDSVAAF
jgi:hypothetical protein